MISKISSIGNSEARGCRVENRANRSPTIPKYLPSFAFFFHLLIIMNYSQESSIYVTGQREVRQESSQPQTPTAKPAVPCVRTWINLGQKCFKINNGIKNFESAKNKCRDLNAKLALIEDDHQREGEMISSSTSHSNILSYLSAHTENFTRPYLVMLAKELYNQSHDHPTSNSEETETDHVDSESPISDLWLPRDDPSLKDIILNQSDRGDSEKAFVLAFSKQFKRWGIVPVSPTRKMSYICEQPIYTHSSSSNNDQSAHRNQVTPMSANNPGQNADSRRTEEVDGKPRDLSINFSAETRAPDFAFTDTRRTTISLGERSSPTTPQPEIQSMLFREIPQDQSIILGSTAEIRCSPLESGSSMQWNYNGRRLAPSNRIKIHPNGTLRIEHVRNTDDGNYTCTIHSSDTSESRSARLEIIERPHQPEYITAELLDKLSTSVRIKWTPGFNGNSPIQKYRVEMRTVNNDNFESELSYSAGWEVAKANISADQTSVIIPDLKPAKKYIFRITASNRVGTGEPSLPTRIPIEVPVQPPSMAPEKLTGTPRSSTSISLQWSPPPADSQNGAIKGYKIRHKLAGYASDSDWYTSDLPDVAHLNHVLDDLIVWQNYEIQIAAENDKGVGPFSASIFVRTKEGRPDKGPRSVSAETISSTSIRVNWNPPPPQHINGLNQGYKLQAWLDSAQTQLAKELIFAHNTSSPIHTTIVDSLLPYTQYYVTVKCFTNAGDGPAQEDQLVVRTKQDIPESVASLEFADVLDKSLKIIWRPPNRINGELDHYTLEYSESSAYDKKIFKRFAPGTTEARITDLNPQTSYTFTLFPFTVIGQGPGKTAEIKTSVPPVLPEPPTNVICTNIGPRTVTLQFERGFDGNANIDQWNVEAFVPARNDAQPPRWQNIYVSSNHSNHDNSIVVKNLKPYTKYRLRIRPVNIVGPSLNPSESTTEFHTAQTEPEQPPRDFSIERIEKTSVEAHWLPLANNLWLGQPRGYNLTWSEANNSTVMYHFINDSRADSYTIFNLEEYTEYSFKIYSVNSVGQSPPCEPVTKITLEDSPSASPMNVTAHALSSNSIAIDWSPVPKRHRNGIIRGYRIQYQAIKPDASIQHKTLEDNSTKHVTINDLKAYTSYQLAIAAYTSVGDGVFSSIVRVQTLENTPGKPQNLSSPTVSQTSARILWDPPEEPNGDILGYKVSYQTISEANREPTSHELLPTERTYKATKLKPDTHYYFTVSAKTKEGWGQQASIVLYTFDSELTANLPFYRQNWFVIGTACSSIVITIIVAALLYIQTKSYKYKQNAIKSASQDRLGDAGFSIDDEPTNHYNNNGFSLISHNVQNHRRSNGAISQSTANFTLPKTPPRPHPGSLAYSDDEGDDDNFDDIVDKSAPKSVAGTSHYDSSGDSLTEKPSEISSSPAPESESQDDEYVNMASRNFVNHYANVNGTIRGQRAWRRSKQYGTSKGKPRLPQRPAPSVPIVPGNEAMSDNGHPVAGTSGIQSSSRSNASLTLYGESQGSSSQQSSQISQRTQASSTPSTNMTASTTMMSGSQLGGSGDFNNNNNNNNNPPLNLENQPADLLNSHIVNLNGGRIIVDNMAGSRAPLPGFTSFV